MKHALLTALALFLAPLAATAAEAGRPNILFIMVDEMKWNVMSCEGHPLVKTPHLDRLAREGTRFATTYTVAPICTPSRYSFFTSRYAHVHGATDNSTPTRQPQLLLPALLNHSGYQTAISGKLHFIPANVDYAFERFWSFAGEGPRREPSWPDSITKKYDGPIMRRVTDRPFPKDALGGDLGKLTYPQADTQTEWITDRAVEFLGSRDASRPFFLFVSYLDPHSPSHLAEPYWSMFKADAMPLPATFKADPASSSATASNRHEVNDPQIVKAMTAAYFAKVAMIDANVGRLLERLNKAGLDKHTLIVFTADHGNMLGDHNRWFKGVMYEGSARIPLLMKAPAEGRFAADFNRGKVIGEIVENIDVMPTLCEMAGVKLPSEGIQGRSLTQLVAGRETAWKNVAFAERGSKMIRTPGFKLIQNSDKEVRRDQTSFELYDMLKDPGETRNLAADPAYAATLSELRARLEAWEAQTAPVPTIAGVPLAPTGGAAADASGGKKGDKRAAKRAGRKPARE